MAKYLFGINTNFLKSIFKNISHLSNKPIIQNCYITEKQKESHPQFFQSNKIFTKHF